MILPFTGDKILAECKDRLYKTHGIAAGLELFAQFRSSGM